MGARWAGSLAMGGAFVAVCALSGGCHLISGLADLTVEDTGGSGGTGGAGGSTGGGGEGGVGGSTTSSSAGPCADGEQNGEETDTDCGGTECGPCAVGDTCSENADCASEICRGKLCAAVTSISVGNAHACATLDTGELFCWGENASGQLGLGDVEPREAPALLNLTSVARVAAGGLPEEKGTGHTCALAAGGLVYCWGANATGQLGLGDTQGRSEPAVLGMLSGVMSITAGGAFSCAITSGSRVACWGANESWQLGEDLGPTSLDPHVIGALLDVTRVGAGLKHACAVLAAGTATCWGSNDKGQLGPGAATNPSKPAGVAGLEGATRVGVGRDATCALDAMGLLCWGDNSDAQLTGAVMEEMTATPTKLRLAGVVDVALGADGDVDANDSKGGHGCAVLPEGKVACWGNNRSGQLGRGTTSEMEATPLEIEGLSGVVEVALGAEVTCARLANGGARCWGRNDRGQLGIGVKGDAQSSPVAVAWP